VTTVSAPGRPEETTAELLARYDGPGPRYTSYPTAVEFHDGVTDADYERRLARADESADEPLSLYLHLPFCQERCLFCGCNVIITPHLERATPYLELLRKEIGMLAERLPRRRKFAQLHLGGGTPTYFPPAELTGLLRDLLAVFEPAEGAELAVEVDPRVTTTEHIDALAELGFNRLSCGVQDFTPEVQEAIGRIQSLEQTRDIIEHARSHGFGGINVDLIYGLPNQTAETFAETVDAVIELGADRTAVYSFAYVPWVGHQQRRIEKEDLPPRELKLGLFAMARERFLAAGYEPIGMDHFAKPDDELSVARREGRLRRNFQGYTVLPGSDVVGLGISAIGDVAGGYFQNAKKLSEYEQLLAADRLPVLRGVLREPDDDLRREVIHDLMCNFRILPAEVGERHSIDFASYFEPDLERLRVYEDEGLVTIAADRIEATPTGRLFVRNLAMCFDRYWREKHETSGQATFSRTV
jgi:oxygen-independent coproporphyrinogen-3 oxidase